MQGAVLVVLEAPDAAPGLLAAAAQIAPMLSATVHALALRIPAEATILPSEEVLSQTHRADWEAGEQQRLAALRVHADASGVRLHVATGAAASRVQEAAAMAGLLVLARPTADSSRTAWALLHAALFASSRPVLLVPPGFTGPFGHRIAIAWQEDGRAEKAVLAALPLLRKAAHISLLATVPVMPGVLRDANLVAEPLALPEHPDDSLGATILREAADCDLLVMGAYGHSRLREFIFGGVTRHVLAEAALPLLMCH